MFKTNDNKDHIFKGIPKSMSTHTDQGSRFIGESLRTNSGVEIVVVISRDLWE